MREMKHDVAAWGEDGAQGLPEAYSGALAGALTYHAAFLLILIAQEWRHPGGPLPYGAPGQALAVMSIVAVSRVIVARVRRSASAASRAIGGDLVVLFLVLAIIALVALPRDSSGAVLFAFITMTPVSIALVTLVSALSLLVQRSRTLRIVLAIVVVIDAVLAVVAIGLGMNG